MQVLLIDDEPLELFLSKRFLGTNHRVEGFGTLPEALEWAKANSFDILVSDYYLGGNVHATNVLQELMALKGKTFKSFVLTNYVDADKTKELKAAGYDAVIEKPLTLEKFNSVAGL